MGTIAVRNNTRLVWGCAKLQAMFRWHRPRWGLHAHIIRAWPTYTLELACVEKLGVPLRCFRHLGVLTLRAMLKLSHVGPSWTICAPRQICQSRATLLAPNNCHMPKPCNPKDRKPCATFRTLKNLPQQTGAQEPERITHVFLMRPGPNVCYALLKFNTGSHVSWSATTSMNTSTSPTSCATSPTPYVATPPWTTFEMCDCE